MKKGSIFRDVRKANNDVYDGLPTEFELASLAAMVMQAVPDKGIHDYVEIAWDLHYCAKCKIGELVEHRNKYPIYKKRTAPILAGLPKPKRFPVSLEKALGLLLPNHRKIDRLQIYQEFLNCNRDISTGNNGWEQWEKTMQNGMDELCWKVFGLGFVEFLDVRKSEVRSDRARRAGMAPRRKK